MNADELFQLHCRLLLRRNLIFPDRKLMLGHSFRGGSSLVTRIFFKAYGMEDEIRDSGYVHRGYRDFVYNPRLMKGMSAERLSEMMKSPTYTRIKFVRCPYRRAVSSYLYSMGKEMQGADARIRPIRTDIPQFRDKPESIYMSFHQFLSVLDKLSPLEPHMRDNHYAQQLVYFENTMMRYDEICRLENLSELLPELNRRHGLDIDADIEPIQRSLASHHLSFRDDVSTYVDRISYPELFISGPDGNALFPNYKYFYSPMSRRLVEKIFAKDLECYGYEFTPREW